MLALLTGRLGFIGAASLFGVTALVAAWLAFGKASATRDLNHTRTWSESVCEAAGTPYTAKDARGRPTPRKPWEAACLTAVRALATFERETKLAMANAVLSHQAEQAAKADTDRTVAQSNTTRRLRARQKVDHANSQATGDRRGPEYLGSLNELMGLSDAPEADLGSASSGGTEGDPAERPAPMSVASAGLPD